MPEVEGLFFRLLCVVLFVGTLFVGILLAGSAVAESVPDFLSGVAGRMADFTRDVARGMADAAARFLDRAEKGVGGRNRRAAQNEGKGGGCRSVYFIRRTIYIFAPWYGTSLLSLTRTAVARNSFETSSEIREFSSRTNEFVWSYIL